MGDAGAIVTCNRELSVKSSKTARHGGINKGEHLVIGRNSAWMVFVAILSVKIKHIVKWTEEDKISSYYIELLDGLGIRLPKYELANGSVFHLFVIETKQRDKLRKYLKENLLRPSLTTPSLYPFYQFMNTKHKAKIFQMPIKTSSNSFLPLFPEMSISQQDEVVEAIKKFFV